MTARRDGRRKRLAGAVGLGLVALVLSACGARIDTQLTVDAEGAGSRVMTLTLADNHDSLVGGAAAVDASIARHKPAQVDYSGLTTGPAGELVATFTVPFADPQEYTADMVALLAASDQQWSQENDFVVEQSRFIQGATVEEQFGSHDLLQWMFDGLLADGVVEESSSGDMFEIGATTVTFNGVAYEASSPISFSEVDDRGFDSVEMATTFEDEGYSRVITYALDDKAVYKSGQDVFDGFFAEVEASGASVEQDAAQVGVTWDVSFTADSPERLVELTNGALLSEETAFDVTVEALEEDPATSSITVVDYADCAAICSPEASPITEVLSVPAAYSLVSGGEVNEDGTVTSQMSSSGDAQVFHAVYPFASVTSELAVGMTGGLTWTGTFVVDAEDAATVGEGFTTLLTPPDGAGDIDVSTTDDTTVYTVTIEGADAGELADAYREWSGYEATSLVVTELPGANLLREEYVLSGDLGLSSVVAAHTPSEVVEQGVALPFGQTFDTESVPMPELAVIDGSHLTVDGQGTTAFSATVSGTSLVGFVVYGVLALTGLGALVLALVFRERLAAAIARRRDAGRGRRAAVTAAAPAVDPGLEQPGLDPVLAGAPSRRDAAATRAQDDVDLL